MSEYGVRLIMNYFSKIPRRMYRFWRDVPIRYKLATVLGILLGFMWIIVFLNVVHLQSLTRESGRIMGQYEEITDFINAFSAENICMDAYVRPSHTKENERTYFEAAEITDQCLTRLQPDLKTDLHDDYMLKRAIVNAMTRYRQDRASFIAAEEYQEKIRSFLLLQRQAVYINQYSLDLLHSRMEAGEKSWSRIEADNRHKIRIIFGNMILATILTVLGLILLIRTILQPLLSLSAAADEISAGNYSHPPLEETGNDEIGRTARSFNFMQTQIKETILAMEREAEMEKENARIQKALQESRYAELQSQIDPHFLFNTLNAIAALAHEENAPITEDLIERLAKIFRYSLESYEKQVTLGQELQYLGDYMELMDARYAGRISMVIEPFDENLNNRVIPKFILQTIAENSIIHGFRDITGGGEILVTISEDENHRLRIVMSDNGCGFDSANPPKKEGHHSVGLDNIRERLKYLGGTMEIESAIGAGTQVRIII